MANVGLSISGMDAFIAKLEAAPKQVERQVNSIVKETAFDVQADAQRLILQSEPSGILYQKYKPKKLHRASAPGEAPASDTGTLAGSIETEQVSESTYKVGTVHDYGLYLEYGTTQMEARPWMNPTLEKNRVEFFDRLKQALDV